jgi:TonB-linked SusC/RagA family outer membrane protein
MKKLLRFMWGWLENGQRRQFWMTIKLTMLLFFFVITQITASAAFSQATADARIVMTNEAGQTGFEQQSGQQQGQKISGKVTDTSGAPLPGVSVVIKGTATGVITDNNGTYSFSSIPENATLQFSFVGTKMQEVLVKGKTNLDVVLQEETIGLDEVVAIGYGTKRKRDITSAVSVVNINSIPEMPISNASRLLQGQAPGVVVRQRSGTPGEQMNVTIRGVGSLGAGSDPLYVIDGFAVGTSIGQNLNPSDIESITILKDAASTAIYGARGSNGVVLVTTKNAKEGELSITATANFGMQTLPSSRRIKMMNGKEFATFLQESWIDKQRYFNKHEPTTDEIPIGIRNPEQTKYSTDWLDEILHQNAGFQDYNVTLASGKGKLKSLVSAGFLNQEGAVKETGFKRYNVRANLTGDFNKYISVGLNAVGSFTSEDYANSTGRDAIIGKALWADPRSPVYNEDGTFNAYVGGKDGVFGAANPLMELVQYKRKKEVTNLTTNGFVQISFLENLKFKSSFNASIDNWRRNEFRPSTLAAGGFNSPPPQNATLAEYYDQVINLAADQLLSYNTTIGSHKIEGQIGYSAQSARSRNISGSGNKFPNNDIQFLQQAETKTVTSSQSEWSMLAYFARLNYDYKDKYMLTATYRREGSSRFGKNNLWGDFPSVSVGWRLSQESFMSDFSWLNDLKLRGSYGVTGNNSIGEYNNAASLAAAGYIFNDTFAPGVVLNSFVNNNIGWEQSDQVDIGLDLSAFDNKLTFTAEYYKKITNDMLLSVSVPVITGFTSTLTNVGKVQNTGFEFAAGYKTNITRDVKFNSNFNISFNRNKVLEIDGNNKELWSGSFYGVQNRSVIGRPIGMITGFKVIGIFQTDAEVASSPTQDGAIPGVYKYFDGNGDGKISYDTKDMVEIGDPYPAFEWGLTLGANYKRFDINMLFMGAQHYDIMRDIEKTVMNMDGVFNILQSGVNRFRSATQPGDGRGATSNTWKWERESNSRYVYDASHMWIKTLTIGYTLPAGSKMLKSSRFYFNIDNLLLVTNYPGTNPEINTSGDNRQPGRDDEAYPVPRTYSIGAIIKF